MFYITFSLGYADVLPSEHPVSTTRGGRDRGLGLDPNKDFAIDFIVFAIWLANVSFDFRGFGQPVSTTRGGRDRGLRLYPNKDFAIDFMVFATWFAIDSIEFRGFGQPVSTPRGGRDRGLGVEF